MRCYQWGLMAVGVWLLSACNDQDSTSVEPTQGIVRSYLSTIAGNPFIRNLSLLQNETVLLDLQSDDLNASFADEDVMTLLPDYIEPESIASEKFYLEGLVLAESEPVRKVVPAEFSASILRRYQKVRFGVVATTLSGDTLEVVTPWVVQVGSITIQAPADGIEGAGYDQY